MVYPYISLIFATTFKESLVFRFKIVNTTVTFPYYTITSSDISPPFPFVGLHSLALGITLKVPFIFGIYLFLVLWVMYDLL